MWVPRILFLAFPLIPNKDSVSSFYRHRRLLSLRKVVPSDAAIHDARELLSWEAAELQMTSPLLNLSERDPDNLDFNERSTGKTNRLETSDVGGTEWEDSSTWEATRLALEEIQVLPTGSSGANLLSALPQLLRLPTDTVVRAAELVCSRGGGPGVLEADPRLLAYRPDQIERGLSFLTTMTASPEAVVTALCAQNPALLAAGIEGSLQEKAVASVLESAGTATSKASTAAVMDASTALKQLRNPCSGG